MSEPNRDDPRAVVLAFAAAYTRWEKAVHLTKNGLDDPLLRKQCDEIIHDYCTHKKRAYIDGVYSYATPPTYGQVVEATLVNVEAVTRSRTYVDTGQLQGKAYRFVVVKKTDGWRIDGVKWRFSDDDEWENTLIGS